MLKILIVTVFFIVAFSLMAMALHFAKWKKKKSGCCGGGHCDSNGGGSCHNEKVDYINEKIIKPKMMN